MVHTLKSVLNLAHNAKQNDIVILTVVSKREKYKYLKVIESMSLENGVKIDWDHWKQNGNKLIKFIGRGELLIFTKSKYNDVSKLLEGRNIVNIFESEGLLTT